MPNKTTPTRCGLTLSRATVPLQKAWRGGDAAPLTIPKTFNFEHAEVEDLAGLGRLLLRLQDNPFAAVIRGGIADPTRAEGVRRLTAPDPVTGEPATLVELPRRWVALDLDNVPLPAGAAPRDLSACARHALALLPAAFRAAGCVVQATASHGIKPGARLRLWFWLSRPALGAELARWLAGSPVDSSCFRAGQLIFTARPRFVGMPDPLPCRLALLPGADAVEVPPTAALRPPSPPPRPQRAAIADDGAGALVWGRAYIASAPLGARHDTALRVAGWLFALAREGRVRAEAIAPAITAGLIAAGKTESEARDICRYIAAKEGAR